MPVSVPLRRFGPQRVKVPVIGQGTWHLELDDPEEVLSALERGIELGLRHIDTAELYGDGAVEKLLSEIVPRYRDKLFLASKVIPSHASREGTIKACERSLRRLGTDHLDVYLLHWRGEYPLEETFAAFEDLSRAGKILSWGVSNFDVTDLHEALQLAGEGRIACNQVAYYLQERYIESELIPFCTQHQIAVVGYSPFGSGRFPSSQSLRGKLLQQIGRKHGASARQVALAFLARTPNVFLIPKSSRGSHVEENAEAASLKLDAEDIARIEDAFPLTERAELPVI
jgi:diketogulonate reductase-like aldo/keto reductase